MPSTLYILCLKSQSKIILWGVPVEAGTATPPPLIFLHCMYLQITTAIARAWPQRTFPLNLADENNS